MIHESTYPTSRTRRILLQTGQHLSPTPRIHYINHTFDVPPGASEVGVIFTFHKEKQAQLFLSLYTPDGRFRGSRMDPKAVGQVRLELWTRPDDASEGTWPGPLPAGTWRLQIDIERLGEETDYLLEAYACFDKPATAGRFTTAESLPEQPVIQAAPGWYRGELHAHSTESDGRCPVDIVIEAAQEIGLDFFALTDHFTNSQWRKLARHLHRPLALLRSLEITSHQGHANLHGLQRWVDPYVDRDDWTMNHTADAAHDQGGLFCVNHAYSGDLGWRAWDFDWDKADAMEIYHNLEGINNVYQLGLWDRLLGAGHRVIGVGGIDSHHPFEGRHALGQVVTWVYADELSERGIVDGIKRGWVYVSRGPKLHYRAQANGQTASMWETVESHGQPVRFTAEILAGDATDLRLYVIRDGLYLTSIPLAPIHGSWQTLTFEDRPTKRAYYRLEIHRDLSDPDTHWIKRRDHHSVRLLSNPIWVQPG